MIWRKRKTSVVNMFYHISMFSLRSSKAKISVLLNKASQWNRELGGECEVSEFKFLAPLYAKEHNTACRQYEAGDGGMFREFAQRSYYFSQFSPCNRLSSSAAHREAGPYSYLNNQVCIL